MNDLYSSKQEEQLFQKKKNHKTPKNKLIDIIKLLFVMNAILKAWEQDQPEEPEW